MVQLLRTGQRGLGWVLGFAVLLGVGSALVRGRRSTIKAGMKATMRARETAAEATERLRDVYAEAASEQQAESPRRGAT
jgi:hypothetical protein